MTRQGQFRPGNLCTLKVISFHKLSNPNIPSTLLLHFSKFFHYITTVKKIIWGEAHLSRKKTLKFQHIPRIIIFGQEQPKHFFFSNNTLQNQTTSNFNNSKSTTSNNHLIQQHITTNSNSNKHHK